MYFKWLDWFSLKAKFAVRAQGFHYGCSSFIIFHYDPHKKVSAPDCYHCWRDPILQTLDFTPMEISGTTPLSKTVHTRPRRVMGPSLLSWLMMILYRTASNTARGEFRRRLSELEHKSYWKSVRLLLMTHPGAFAINTPGRYRFMMHLVQMIYVCMEGLWCCG